MAGGVDEAMSCDKPKQTWNFGQKSIGPVHPTEFWK